MSGATLGMSETYNSHSLPQKHAVQSSTEYIQAAIDALDVICVNIIADFGSSQGANSIYAMKTIIECLRKANKIIKEPLIVHNDLPTNDWTSLFQLLINDNSYNGVASGRSFYEQCLPHNSLSIGYSSTCLHWLSKKPCNISNHGYINFAKNPEEYQAFKYQSYLDYSNFLQYRSNELVSGGVLILNIPCNNKHGKTGLDNIHELTYQCAQLLPLTSDELLDYTLPVYCRSYDECIDENLFAKHSFQLIKSDIVRIESPHLKQLKEEQITLDEFFHLTTSFVRSWSEPILQQVLINNGRTKENISIVLNHYWTLFEEKLREKPEIANVFFEYVYIILKKK